MSLAALKTDADSTALSSPYLAGYLKASGDPLRLDVLRVLKNNAYSVLELCQLFGIKQSGMSHHLKVLANAGLVSTRREGNTIFYRRNPAPQLPELATLHQALFATVDELAIDGPVALQIAAINQLRNDASKAFFQQNADRFADNQDLIASFQDYGPSVIELLESGPRGKQSALEIGPGRGELLTELSRRFTQVYALDNAEQILALSKHTAASNSLTNVAFLLGDITHDDLDLPAVDCITLNMVLHHIPQPAEIFPNLARLLQPGGTLLVTDLCQHEQEWVKKSCGDLWQGFSAEELNQWATEAGLEPGQSLFLALRNGFNIQLTLFHKPAS